MSQFIAQGLYPKYVTATGVVKNGPARLTRIIVTTVTVGATTFYDNASAASGNVIFVVPAAAAAGTIYLLDWPCINGIYVSFVTSGTLAISFDDGISGQ